MEMLGNIRWMEVGLFGKQVMLLPLPRTVRSEPAFCVGCYSLICWRYVCSQLEVNLVWNTLVSEFAIWKQEFLVAVIEILGSHSPFHAGILALLFYAKQLRLVIWFNRALTIMVIWEKLNLYNLAAKLVLEDSYDLCAHEMCIVIPQCFIVCKDLCQPFSSLFFPPCSVVLVRRLISACSFPYFLDMFHQLMVFLVAKLFHLYVFSHSTIVKCDMFWLCL
jgi:hypothetical protein